MMRMAINLAPVPQAVPPVIPSMEVALRGDPDREEVQRYIAGVFQITHGATVNEFMPLLVSLRDHGRLTSALGLRGAAGGHLFSEQYLEEPVEEYVQAKFGRNSGRGRILEMGNLVASNPGHASLLYTLVGAALYEAGIDYLVFTANRAVRLSLKRSGLDSVPIARADRRLLAAGADKWGSYYTGDPQVMIGDVRAAMEGCTARAEVRDLVRRHRAAIDELIDLIQLRLK